MSTTPPLSTVPTVEQAATRAWRISHLLAEKAIDRNAALFSLSLLYQTTDSDRVRRLCMRIAESVQAPAAPMPEPVVEVFAR